MPAEAISHPIDGEIVQEARQQSFGQINKGLSIEKFHNLLDLSQEELQARLDDLHREAVNGSERMVSWGETQKETPQKYVFIGGLDGIWNRVFESLGIDDKSAQQLVKDAHFMQAESYGLLPEKEVIIVAKPFAWIKGQSAARSEIRNILKSGLSPAEVVDLWLTEYGHRFQRTKQSVTADQRGVSQQAVSKNVKSAHRKLRNQQTIHIAPIERPK